MVLSTRRGSVGTGMVNALGGVELSCIPELSMSPHPPSLPSSPYPHPSAPVFFISTYITWFCSIFLLSVSLFSSTQPPPRLHPSVSLPRLPSKPKDTPISSPTVPYIPFSQHVTSYPPLLILPNMTFPQPLQSFLYPSSPIRTHHLPSPCSPSPSPPTPTHTLSPSLIPASSSSVLAIRPARQPRK